MQKRRFLLIASVVVLAALCVGLIPQIPATEQMASAATANVWEYSGTYYDNLNTDKQGAAFRSDLAALITKNHSNSSYDGLKDLYKTSDADPNKSGNILWFYTGTSVPYNGNMGSDAGETNREHVWDKKGGKAFPEKSDAGSDGHNLRPTDARLNNLRGNKPFDEVSQTTSNIVPEANKTSYGNPENGIDALCYTDGYWFYPAKGYRGQVARIMFYVQTRWGNQYNLSFVDDKAGIGDKTMGKISTLLKWHLEEPPTQTEITRNEEVYKVQHNRNPFIDHPEYAAQIYCYDGNSYNTALQNVLANSNDPYGNLSVADLENISVTPSTSTLIVGDTLSLKATPQPSNASAKVVWSTSNSAIATVSDAGVVTAVSAGQATITATSQSDSSIKATAVITVKDVKSIAVTGTPTKTQYSAGETFNPSGLTVTLTYTDNTTEQVANSTCSWLDATTQKAYLSAGTTSVVCKLGSLTQTISGITVSESSVTPKPPVVGTGISIDVSSLTIVVGGVQTIPVSADGDILWSSSKTSVATVSNGQITALSAGHTTITAICGTKSATLEVFVVDRYDSAAFIAAVNNIGTVKHNLDTFNNINNAIAIYNELSQADRSAVSTQYSTLQQAISDYNSKIAVANNAMNTAATVALTAASPVAVALLAVIALLKNKLL